MVLFFVPSCIGVEEHKLRNVWYLVFFYIKFLVKPAAALLRASELLQYG